MVMYYGSLTSGCSSVGRAAPCQGAGREFEPRQPLQSFICKKSGIFLQVKPFPSRLTVGQSTLDALIVVRIHGGEPLHPTFTVGCLYTIWMPNSPKTPTRTIRVSDNLWSAVQKKAAAEKVTVTSVIIRALQNYIKEDK